MLELVPIVSQVLVFLIFWLTLKKVKKGHKLYFWDGVKCLFIVSLIGGVVRGLYLWGFVLLNKDYYQAAIAGLEYVRIVTFRQESDFWDLFFQSPDLIALRSIVVSLMSFIVFGVFLAQVHSNKKKANVKSEI